MSAQGQLEIDIPAPTQPLAPPNLKHGETGWMGNWQVRNFHGFHQSREGGCGKWQFYVSGFGSMESGTCTVMLYGGGKEPGVPIDNADRITILGKKYGREYWNH